jgi:hypothetical protein
MVSPAFQVRLAAGELIVGIGGSDLVMRTFPNFAVVTTPSLWLVTASRTLTLVPLAIVSELICVQLLPLPECQAVKLLPLRFRRTTQGRSLRPAL